MLKEGITFYSLFVFLPRLFFSTFTKLKSMFCHLVGLCASSYFKMRMQSYSFSIAIAIRLTNDWDENKRTKALARNGNVLVRNRLRLIFSCQACLDTRSFFWGQRCVFPRTFTLAQGNVQILILNSTLTNDSINNLCHNVIIVPKHWRKC